MFLNWYRLVQEYRGSDTSAVTATTFDNRQISKFDWLVAFVVPLDSKYVRGFAILPRAVFLEHGAIECTFLKGTIVNYADIAYVDDTHVKVNTTSVYGTTIYLYGISIGAVDFSS